MYPAPPGIKIRTALELVPFQYMVSDGSELHIKQSPMGFTGITSAANPKVLEISSTKAMMYFMG
jgi:hypothetical protein